MGNCCATVTDLLLSKSSTSSSSSNPGLAAVKFDPKYRASTINIINKTTIDGNGTVLCDTPIDQLRAFWEFEIEDMGTSNNGQFSLGVVRRANLKPPPNDKGWCNKQLGEDARSKCLCSTEAGVDFSKGDVLGVALDMNYKRLQFYLNGVSLEVEITLEPRFCAPFPAISVKNNVRLSANWSGPFAYFPNTLESRDYEGIVAARSIL